MRNLILYILASCTLFSCKPKEETTVNTTTTQTTNDAPYKGQLITAHRDSSGTDRDTFNNCELKLVLTEEDSTIGVRIKNLDNNVSLSLDLSMVMHSVEDNRDFYLYMESDPNSLMSIQLPKNNDSVYLDYTINSTPSTSLYFYGERE